MASIRDIKNHKESIQNTQQITKAMELVATVKLQRARNRAEQSKPYSEYMYKAVATMIAMSGDIIHHYLTAIESRKKAVIMITANRGLAGGYNMHLTKKIINSHLAKEDVYLYAVGRKGKEYMERRGYEIKGDYSEVINEPMYKDAAEISRAVLEAFVDGEVGEIYLAYTSFQNTVSHEPILRRILPVIVETDVDYSDRRFRMNYEPKQAEALHMIVPQYITSLIYDALVESVASENAARMQAMDSATNNAEEMIENLSLKYNRARQGSITQELTEIIAGANAIS
ncbi:ATP synthase F1 subunit gamma [Konateibacter massiliensis]|uniref:ATP synthase F1 subunit gamma n=1 Tax=Konateibacter massiliensis TaxID=2002841 RepID=UPI000C15C28F|nr:ATP synthase F1 subunit gamma [Konateibacter massiliensis]